MRRLKLYPVTALLLLASLMLVAAGCGSDDSDSGSGGDVPSNISVGSDIPYKPFEFGKAPYEGFDVDIVNEIAKRLDTEATFEKTAFDTIFRDLAQDKFDMVASATTITKERLQQVDFSNPYFPADQSLTVKKGSDIKSVDDLAGKTVGVQAGTTGEAYAKDDTDAASVRPYDLADDAFNALNAGQVDAAIVDFPVAADAAKAKPDLDVVQRISTDEYYGLGFPKGSDLVDKFNEQLSDMKEDGTYTEIYKKWFGEDPPQSFLDSDQTAQQVAIEG